MSNYDMLQRILENKPYVLRVSNYMPEIEIPANDWLLIEHLEKTLKSCKTATEGLQLDNLTFSAFYRIWMTCIIDLESLGESK